METTKKQINYIDREELQSYLKNGHLSVGSLRRFLKKNPELSDDTPVVIQRVEDMYYDGFDFNGSQTNGWGVWPHKGESYWSAESMNKRMLEEIETRESGKEWQYPKIEDPNEFIYDLEDKGLLDLYSPAWCIFTDKEKDITYINLHY